MNHRTPLSSLCGKDVDKNGVIFLVGMGGWGSAFCHSVTQWEWHSDSDHDSDSASDSDTESDGAFVMELGSPSYWGTRFVFSVSQSQANMHTPLNPPPCSRPLP